MKHLVNKRKVYIAKYYGHSSTHALLKQVYTDDGLFVRDHMWVPKEKFVGLPRNVWVEMSGRLKPYTHIIRTRIAGITTFRYERKYKIDNICKVRIDDE